MIKHLAFLMVLISSSSQLFADEAKTKEAQTKEAQTKVVRVQWEEVEKASSYDIEIFKAENSSSVEFIEAIKTNSTVLKLPFGEYQFRIRSRNQSNVPGEWSMARAFSVKKPSLIVQKPMNNSIISAVANVGLLPLAWNDFSGGPLKVDIEILQMKGGDWNKTFSGVTVAFEIEVPVGFQYEVRMKPVGAKDSEWVSHTVRVLGAPLELPKLKIVSSSKDKVNLELQSDKASVNTEIKIQKIDTESGSIILVETQTLQNGARIEIKRAGLETYLLSAQSHSLTRVSSDVATQVLTPQLDHLSSSRNFASDSVYKRFADRTLNASYILSSVSYSSTSYEKSSRTTTRGLTGTACLGLTDFDSTGKKGWHFGADLGGLVVDGKNQTVFSGQVGRLSRWSFSAQSDLRFQYGLRYSEVPEFILPETGAAVISKSWLLSPYAQVEYWHHLTRAWGAQFFANYSSGFVGKSYNDKDISSSSRLGLGIQAAYRLNESLLLLAGFSRFEELLEYDGQSPVGGMTGKNNVEVKGDYLFLSFEWWVP